MRALADQNRVRMTDLVRLGLLTMCNDLGDDGELAAIVVVGRGVRQVRRFSTGNNEDPLTTVPTAADFR